MDTSPHPPWLSVAGHCQEHDIALASAFGMLGSVDSNIGDPQLGWDTDNFPMNLQDTASVMAVIVAQGGLGSGGLNFDCKVRRESVDPVDLFYGHIGAMDCYALGLRKAAKMHEEGILRKMLEERYISWSKGDLAKRIMKGTATLEECTEYAKSLGEPKLESGRQELFEITRNRNLYSSN